MQSSILKITAKTFIADSSSVMDHATVIVHEGRVREIGPAESLTGVKADRVVRLPGHTLHPGFVNAHCHLDLSFLKGKLRRHAAFADWIRSLVAARSRASRKVVSDGIKMAIARMLQTGTTCVGDISTAAASPPRLIKAGMRAVVFHETLGYRPELAAERLSEVEKRIESAQTTDLVKHGVSPHSVYSVSQALMKGAADYARRKNIPLAIHLCETPEETLFARKGRGPLRELLEDLGAFPKGGVLGLTPVNAVSRTGALDSSLAIHMNHSSRGDVSTLKKHGARVVICPNSNRWFGRETTASFYDFILRGIPVGMGTDSLASNDDLDMASEMRTLMKSFPDISHRQAFDLATAGGAGALGLGDGVGTLRVGAPFDAVAVLTKSGRKENPLRAIMRKNREVHKVWTAGRERYRNMEAVR